MAEKRPAPAFASVHKYSVEHGELPGYFMFVCSCGERGGLWSKATLAAKDGCAHSIEQTARALPPVGDNA